MTDAENNSRDADFSESEAPPQESEATKESSGDQSAALKAELADVKDKYLRSLAELENVRKRAIKERSELLKYQGESVFKDLIEVVDDLERANAHAAADPAQLKAGVELIAKKLVQVLDKWEVRGDSAVGKVFDPNRHEALSRVKVADATSGTVVNEFCRAFFYKDRLLRPARVVVAE